MGLIKQAAALLVRNTVPTAGPWVQMNQGGVSPQGSYLQYARQGYQGNEVIYSVITLLMTSAAEPHIIGRRLRRNKAEVRNETTSLLAKGLSLADVKRRLVENKYVEEINDHPLVRLLNNPNPFMSRGQVWSTIVMDLCLAGNAYLLKARALGSVRELWRLRPDRVRIIPGGDYIDRYEYTVGRETTRFDPNDIIHFKWGNPLNDFYGQPPLMAVMGRVDIDNYMRGFLRTFFERGGTGPGAILAVKQKLAQETKDEIRDRLRNQFGGQQGWQETLVLDSAEASYTQLGLNRGLRDALPKEIDAMQEARLTMPFGVPGSIVGLLIGYESSSYANKRADWQVLWDIKMTPMLSDFDDTLNLSIVPDFGNIDEVMFDLSDIRALQEDVDKLQDRYRANFACGGTSRERFLELIGENPDDQSGIVYVPRGVVPTEVKLIGVMEAEQTQNPPPVPAPAEPAPPKAEVRHNCTDGRPKLIARDVEGNPELYCSKCKVKFRPQGLGDDEPRRVTKTVERDGEGRIARVVEEVTA